MKTLLGSVLLLAAGVVLAYGFAFLFGSVEPQTDREFTFHMLKILLMSACLFAGLGVVYLLSPELFK